MKSNDKENEIIKEKNKESCGLTFSLQDSGELSTSFISFLFQERLHKLQKQPPRSI